MFQIEIYEFIPKMSDLYHHFYNNIENRNNPNNSNLIDSPLHISNHHLEDSHDNKFLKMKTLRNSLITQYIDYVKEDNNYIFISESIGDSLDEILDLKMSENVSFSNEEVIKILYQILIAINYFDKKGINLRFIDPKRILISDDGILKIRNFIVDVLFRSEELKFIK